MGYIVAAASQLSLRTKVLVAMLAVLLPSSAIYTAILAITSRDDLLHQVDAKLLTAARAARLMLPPDYHDRIVNAQSIPDADYQRIVDRFNRFCQADDLQYVWSVLVLPDHRIVFTSATSPDKQVANRKHARFFETHSDPGAFQDALQANAPHFSTFQNKWGWGRMVLVPYHDHRGRTYLFGASMAIPNLQAMNRQLLLHALALGGGIVLLSMLVSTILARSTSAPIARQTRELQDANQRLQQATQQANRTATHLRAIIENMTEAMFLADPQGNIFMMNPAALRLLQFNCVEEYQKNLRNYAQLFEGYDLQGRQIPLEDWPLSRLLRGQPVNNYELWVHRLPAGNHWVGSHNGSTVRDASGNILFHIITIRDTTSQKQGEEDLAKAKEAAEAYARQLEAANKELESFSYSVSHDLRAPLRAIDGFSRILLEEYQPTLSVDAQRYLNLVCENARRMGQLIDDLLGLSRLGRQSLHLQTVDCVPIIQQVLQDLASERQGRRVDIRIGPLPLCRADPNLLQSVWQNLLSNALKFTRRREQAVIEIDGNIENGQCLYRVKDNGVGFDPRYADKLFGVFQRLHRAEDFEGTGVGLATVQRIVHRHGGRIRAESQPDRGATFFFTLPKGGNS